MRENKDKKNKKTLWHLRTFQKSGDPRKETKTVIRTVLTLSEWSAPWLER